MALLGGLAPILYAGLGTVAVGAVVVVVRKVSNKLKLDKDTDNVWGIFAPGSKEDIKKKKKEVKEALEELKKNNDPQQIKKLRELLKQVIGIQERLEGLRVNNNLFINLVAIIYKLLSDLRLLEPVYVDELRKLNQKLKVTDGDKLLDYFKENSEILFESSKDNLESISELINDLSIFTDLANNLIGERSSNNLRILMNYFKAQLENITIIASDLKEVIKELPGSIKKEMKLLEVEKNEQGKETKVFDGVPKAPKLFLINSLLINKFAAVYYGLLTHLYNFAVINYDLLIREPLVNQQLTALISNQSVITLLSGRGDLLNKLIKSLQRNNELIINQKKFLSNYFNLNSNALNKFDSLIKRYEEFWEGVNDNTDFDYVNQNFKGEIKKDDKKAETILNVFKKYKELLKETKNKISEFNNLMLKQDEANKVEQVKNKIKRTSKKAEEAQKTANKEPEPPKGGAGGGASPKSNELKSQEEGGSD